MLLIIKSMMISIFDSFNIKKSGIIGIPNFLLISKTIFNLFFVFFISIFFFENIPINKTVGYCPGWPPIFISFIFKISCFLVKENS